MIKEYDVYPVLKTRIANNHIAGLIIHVMRWMKDNPNETIIKVSVIQESPYYLVELTHLNLNE